MTIDMDSPLVRPASERVEQSKPGWHTWDNLRRLPLFPLFVIGAFIFISIFGQWLAPVPFDEQNLRLRFLPRRGLTVATFAICWVPTISAGIF